MRTKRTLQDLSITDNFMFAAIMSDPENCKHLLELVLEIPIDFVEVITEKSLIYHPQFKGVRLDVHAKDPVDRRFNVEMQVKKTPIGKRSRYYHSQMDMELLESGLDYDELPDSYVIFICDYDPFGAGKYRYTFKQLCLEDPHLKTGDGNYTIILNNRGKNPQEIPEKLLQFLNYTKQKETNPAVEYEDNFVKQLQESMQKIKNSREMGARYMTLEELIKDERKEAHEEGWSEGQNTAYRSVVWKMHKAGIPDKTIQDIVDAPLEEIQKWINTETE